MRFDARDFLNNIEAKYPGIKFSFLFSFDKIKPYLERALETDMDIPLCEKCGEPSATNMCRVCELWK